MEDSNPNKHLACVLFPGHVKNAEKAIHLLGGIRQISHIHSEPNKRRLSLSFQPDNPYVKKVYADKKPTAGVVLKVRVKKIKVNNEVKREVLSTTILGRVNSIHRFESLCDFQYLPVLREGDGPLQCILEKLLLSGTDDISVMSDPAPAFIVPTNFTRSDKPNPYFYTSKRYVNKSKQKELVVEDQIHQKLRVDRKFPATRLTFNLVDDLPTEPHEEFVKIKEFSKDLSPDYEAVRKLFEERPIWSPNLIKYHTKIKYASLKVILPYYGICMFNGPWRMFWVRYGYDPRKEPGARFYQCLDFRLRQQAGIYSMVKTRMRFFKSASRVKPVGGPRKKNSNPEEISESSVIFRPGMVPAQKQVFYQYCDVKIPEVEAILAQEPPPGYLCHQKRGWLPPNTDEICRDHIFKHLQQSVLSTHNSDIKMEDQDGSSDDGSNSDDDEGSSTDEPSTSNN